MMGASSVLYPNLTLPTCCWPIRRHRAGHSDQHFTRLARRTARPRAGIEYHLMATRTMSAIHCHQICKTFRQGDEVITGLDHVDMTIETGEFVCLSGPSGSGKTTLLNAIGGLDDSGQRRDTAWANCASTSCERGPLADMRLHHIGFVFQAYNLIPVLSAQENVEFVMQVQGMAARERARKARAILAEVGLEGLENRRPAQLSGGQQQRVAVARAIVSQPDLVLADEPTANLDSVASAQLMELFTSSTRTIMSPSSSPPTTSA